VRLISAFYAGSHVDVAAFIVNAALMAN